MNWYAFTARQGPSRPIDRLSQSSHVLIDFRGDKSKNTAQAGRSLCFGQFLSNPRFDASGLQT